MTRIEKDAIYGEMCRLLTEYESYDEGAWGRLVAAEECYYLLVKIQNNWDELTSEE